MFLNKNWSQNYQCLTLEETNFTLVYLGIMNEHGYVWYDHHGFSVWKKTYPMGNLWDINGWWWIPNIPSGIRTCEPREPTRLQCHCLTLRQSNMAVENLPFIDVFPLKNPLIGISQIAMLDEPGNSNLIPLRNQLYRSIMALPIAGRWDGRLGFDLEYQRRVRGIFGEPSGEKPWGPRHPSCRGETR